MNESSVGPEVAAAEAPGLFPATAWTLVQQAAAGAAAGLAARNELLERYWRPIYIYIRRGGRPAAEAEDLTQAFFVHLLEKDLLARVRLRQVRFRAYLRSVLEHFLANASRTTRARQRSGGRTPLDCAALETWLATSPQEAPAAAFDRMWAIERLEEAVRQLRQELTLAGRAWLADALVQRAGLGDAGGPASVQDLARRHGVTDNQLSVGLHRARARLRELIVAGIRDGVSSPADEQAEVDALFAALRGPRA